MCAGPVPAPLAARSRLGLLTRASASRSGRSRLRRPLPRLSFDGYALSPIPWRTRMRCRAAGATRVES